MASQFSTTSVFEPRYAFLSKPPYPWALVNISQFRRSKISMCISSSVTPFANTNRATEGLEDFMSPLPGTNTMPLIQDTDTLLVDHHKRKVILQEVDVNNLIHQLKENTRRALMMTSDPTTKMKLIDEIQRLGVGYHFEEEIIEILEKHTQVLPDDDLYTMALRFRLQRHNGLHTNPAEVFKNFMDANGNLKESSSKDVEGLLSLYEASYLGAKGEDVLTNAMEFTPRHLHLSLPQLSPKLHKKVIEGLELPRHMRMERIEARRYIEEYGNEDDHNPMVLEFAKLDYNRVQSLLQRELVEVNRWWEHLGLARSLSFVRDRHVECFLWTVGLLPEPKYSNSRVVLAKTIAIMLVIDDIYETYGSYDDLVLFTKAIQRWDLNEMKQLPEYMKVCYMTLYNTNNEICDKILKERGLSVQPFLRKTWIDLVEAYMVEVEWMKRGTIPTLKDYIENGIITSGTYMAFVHLFFLISDRVTQENMTRLLDPYPKFFTLAGTILRLWDDLGTSKEEQERGDVLSSIQLLMKEKNIRCEEEARKQILQVVHGLWNDLNIDLVTPDLVLLPMIKVSLNTSRASQVVYQHNEDSYLSSVENQVQSLFFKPIDI